MRESQYEACFEIVRRSHSTVSDGFLYSHKVAHVDFLVVLDLLSEPRFEMTLLHLVVLDEISVRLCLVNDLTHGSSDLHRELTSCCLCRQYQRIKTILDGLGDIAHLGSGGSEPSLHRRHDLRLQKDGFANDIAPVSDVSLNIDYLFDVLKC